MLLGVVGHVDGVVQQWDLAPGQAHQGEEGGEAQHFQPFCVSWLFVDVWLGIGM